jgi:DNA-binding LacI/PurR family transcriptional regulator
MHALFELGVRIPDQVSVVGFDDIALAAYMNPGLTTVAQDKYAMGRLAVETIVRMLAGETVRGNLMLPVRLVVRGSTGPAC